jgi:hypothetical protein
MAMRLQQEGRAPALIDAGRQADRPTRSWSSRRSALFRRGAGPCDQLPPSPSLHARLGGGFGVDFLERVGRVGADT